MAEQEAEIIECPLKIGKTSFTDCTGSKCGFWSTANTKCAVSTIADFMVGMDWVLQNGINVRNI
jgi:hypothetical protein